MTAEDAALLVDVALLGVVEVLQVLERHAVDLEVASVSERLAEPAAGAVAHAVVAGEFLRQEAELAEVPERALVGGFDEAGEMPVIDANGNAGTLGHEDSKTTKDSYALEGVEEAAIRRKLFKLLEGGRKK